MKKINLPGCSDMPNTIERNVLLDGKAIYLVVVIYHDKSTVDQIEFTIN